MPDRPRVILFGAGASYGAEEVVPFRPPLGAGLFDELRKAYPDAWGKVPDSRRPEFVPNFEPGMKAIWDAGTHDSPVLLRCVAHYFTQFRAAHGNAYSRLFEHLESRGALHGTYFSSLNYECVLEIAARQYGFKEINYDAKSPTAPGTLAAWKLHGSCNFLPASVAGGAGVISYGASMVSWDGEVRIVDPIDARKFIENSAFYPAMAVYMQGKPVHSHPALIKEWQDRWASAIAAARSIGIVGVAPNPADDHLWKPLSEADCPIVAIGDRNAFDSWASTVRGARPTRVIGMKFAESLPEFAKAFAAS